VKEIGRKVIRHVLLEPEQEELLAGLVEADRQLPHDQRGSFLFIQTTQDDFIRHPGLPDGHVFVRKEDLHALHDEGLLRVIRQGAGTWFFDVSSQGRTFYEEMETGARAPVRQVEREVAGYLDAPAFQRRYPKAHRRWAEAVAKLWGSDSRQQLTTIGHLCREAMQEFASALVEGHQPSGVDQNQTHEVARIRAVLRQHSARLSTTTCTFLDALLARWGTVSDLVQRQEHGARRDGRPVVWEAGRRVVFQTAVVMFEIDRALELHERG
jgi:hypothetical protein